MFWSPRQERTSDSRRLGPSTERAKLREEQPATTEGQGNICAFSFDRPRGVGGLATRPTESSRPGVRDTHRSQWHGHLLEPSADRGAIWTVAALVLAVIMVAVSLSPFGLALRTWALD